MALAMKLEVNPNNHDQKYVGFSNGFIKPIGSALPIAQDDWADTLNQSDGARSAPTFYGPTFGNRLQSFQIIDWAGPSGYVLDQFGHVYPFGAVDDIPGGQQQGGVPGPGLQNWFPFDVIRDLYMNPAGDGTGYYLVSEGRVRAIGTGTPDVGEAKLGDFGLFWALAMDWSTKKHYVLDDLGRVFHRNGAAAASVGGQAPLVTLAGWLRAWRDIWIYDWDDGLGWLLDYYGGTHSINGAEAIMGGAYTPHVATFGSFAIIDDGTDPEAPLRVAKLTIHGGINEFVSSTAPTVTTTGVTYPEDPTEDTTRPELQWIYGDAENDAQTSFEGAVITDAVYLAGANNEVQRITITGTPTGGFFQLTFDGHTTADIARNADAATVQAALEALPNIETGDVACGGGALPGAFVTVTFQGKLAAHNWPQMTATHTFTGGTTPAIAITTTTAGVGIDPATATAVFRFDGTDRHQNSKRIGVDLVNDTYRFYIRATDSSELTSEWRYRQWPQDVTPLATPTIVATSLGGLAGIECAVDGDAGLAALGALLGVQYRDSAADAWQWVRDGHALEPDGSGNATVVDLEARFGVERTYRAIAYDPEPWRASALSAEDTATITERLWALTNPFDSTHGGIVSVRRKFEPTRKKVAGVFDELVGRPDPVIVSDGEAKYPKFTLELWALNTATREMLTELVDADVSLMLRDPYGRAWYVQVVGDLPERLLALAPTAGEVTPLRDANEIDIPVHAVARPPTGPLDGPLTEVV